MQSIDATPAVACLIAIEEALRAASPLPLGTIITHLGLHAHEDGVKSPCVTVTAFLPGNYTNCLLGQAATVEEAVAECLAKIQALHVANPPASP